MSGIRRDRNIKVPTRKNKSDSKPSTYLPSRPAEGRKEIPKKVEKKPQPQRPNNRNNRPPQSQNHRSDNRRSKNQRNQRQRVAKPTPLDDEIWARVVEHDIENNVLVLIGESKMLIGRYRPKNSGEILALGSRVYVGIDKMKREKVGDIIGMARLDRLSTNASKELPIVLQTFIEENEIHFIKTFFNPAGYLSLKQHAYELLHGIGNKKAIQMVEERGSSGFTSFENLNESCNIDAAELLAKRFHSEIIDRNLQPRLTDLLLPVKA
jgi:predicted nucleic acid-binding OB-fold protein